MNFLSHCAMSVPMGTITDEFRRDIQAVYGDIFGFAVTGTELRRHDEYQDVRVLSLFLDEGMQNYLVVMEFGTPMTVQGPEHLGLDIASGEEIDEMYGRCVRFAEHDPRMWVAEVPLHTLDDDWSRLDSWTLPAIRRRGFNLKYLLPLSWDIRYNEFVPGREPAHTWQYV
jgi:hypothetical protein